MEEIVTIKILLLVNVDICSAIGGVPPMIKRRVYYEKFYDVVA